MESNDLEKLLTPPPSPPPKAELDAEVDFEAQLKKFFSLQGDKTFDVSVKRYNPATKSWPQVCSFSDVSEVSDISSTEEIGRAYGGGKYKMSIRYELPGGEPKSWSRTFDLDKAYDRYLDKPAPPAQSGGGDTGMMQMMLMLGERQEKASQRSMEMIVAMMTASQTAMANLAAAFAGKPAEKPDLNIELVRELVASKNSGMDNFRKAVVLVNELRRDAEPECDECEGEAEPEEDYIGKVMGFFNTLTGRAQQPPQIAPGTGGADAQP